MVFSSPIFLFCYLPLALAGFFLVPRLLRTPWLVTVSVVFYAWGEKHIVFVLLASILINWALALVVERLRHTRARQLLLVAAVAVNIGALVYYKYWNFLAENLSV